MSDTRRNFFICYLLVAVGLDGLEPSTSVLSGLRSNQLSYRPALLNGCRTRLQQVHPFFQARMTVAFNVTFLMLYVDHANTYTTHKRSDCVVHICTYNSQTRHQHNINDCNDNCETHPTTKTKIGSNRQQLLRI